MIVEVARPAIAPGLPFSEADMSMDTRRIYDAIYRILIDEWDPIGINTNPHIQDEYDHYIGGIHTLLSGYADKVKIVGHLRQLETISMSLTDRDDGRRELVATMLLNLVADRRI